LKETLTRTLTGIFFLAVVILALVLHPYLYLVVFAWICAWAWVEYMGLVFPEGGIFPRVTGALLLAGTFFLVYYIAGGQLPARFLFIPAAFLLFMVIYDTGLKTRKTGRGVPALSAGFLYLGTGFCCLHCLAFQQGEWDAYSPRWILYTCYIIWTYDTLAYVSGRLTGRRPLWARISPGKTWEGSLGGALFAFLLAILLSRFNAVLSLPGWLGFAGVTVLFGTAGDLLESWLKRLAGKKDSGRLLPGHGGMLDRFDSLLLAVPFVNLYLILAL
jgi:phosphatidate cytidylyltransferase